MEERRSTRNSKSAVSSKSQAGNPKKRSSTKAEVSTDKGGSSDKKRKDNHGDQYLNTLQATTTKKKGKKQGISGTFLKIPLEWPRLLTAFILRPRFYHKVESCRRLIR
jgi:hypothetical protein